ncbi:peptide maturation system acyl carrier-related protein [Anaerophilus nitritogenes]|uniref:peptide maturation system acyl carrier-related protein n=1 Tax=Anaerophilus nitritogenes TaxID=2498136 RepID=UPI00101C53C9|nr:peptide maturation system acyl carrier-related protein [Anaerophilus nitritogenes]
MQNEKKLENIFKKYTKISFDMADSLKNKPLLGAQLNITPAILVLILRDIESQYNIKLSKSKVINGNFNTFNNILKMIKEAY